MKWNAMLHRRGFLSEASSGTEYDPFFMLAQLARQNGGAIAKVAFTVGLAHDYGATKCSATVSLECPQDERHIDLAGEMAYRKALELTNAGAAQLEVPQLPVFEEPKS